MVWNGDGLLQRSIDSLQQVHPNLPVEVARLPDESPLLIKEQMNDLSPFDTTLYLDADTVVLGDLSYGFEKAEQHGLACCICECPWANRYPSIEGDIIEYNTGVLFWKKSEEVNMIFDAWKHYNRWLDSSIEFIKQDGTPARMEHNDQAGFAMAVHDLGFNPYVLPLNWNFRQLWHKNWFGSIKIWHDYAAPPRDVASRSSMEFFKLER